MTKLGDEGFMNYAEEAVPAWNNGDAMDLIEQVIHREVGDELLPHIKLLLGIMKSAAEDNDLDYFGSNAFKYHCILLGLDNELILETIVKKRLLRPKPKTNYSYKTVAQAEDRIRWLHDIEGLSHVAIGEIYNVSHRTIRKVLEGFYAPKIAFKGKQQEIIQDYSYGVPVREISKLYGLSESNVYRALEGLTRSK